MPTVPAGQTATTATTAALPRRLALLLAAPLLIGALLFHPPAARAAEPQPQPQVVGKDTRCPVCGMYPARSPQWTAQIVFNDHRASSFDSPVDLFRFLGNMALFDKQHQAADIGAVFVTDYGTKTWIDAKKAFFVAGSTALGPMHDANLPAFASRERAEAFSQAQGGRVLAFAEVTREVVRGLAGAHHH